MISTNLPSTVDIVIPTENVQIVVNLLISNNISFKMISSDYSGTAPAITEPTEIKSDSSIQSISNRSDRKEEIFETIYMKYIKGGMDHIPPKESQIAADFGISLTTFKNGFNAAYGKTFFQLYMEKKMEYAKTLLLMGIPAYKVSKRIGYSSPIKFNKMFQKRFGITPKKYQTRNISRT